MKSLTPIDNWSHLTQLVMNSLDSPRTRESYGESLGLFFTWYRQTKQPGFTRKVVQEFRTLLLSRAAPATVNLRLAAIRKLASEAAEHGFITRPDAAAITGIHGARAGGKPVGFWLTKTQIERLFRLPVSLNPRNAVKAARDRAILMLLTGTGLRRDEAAGLRWGQLQQREGRWVLVDILGKGSKLRTVPVPAFAWVALEEWRTYGVFRDGSEQDLRTDKSDSIFHPVTRYGHVEAASLSPQAIYKLVRGYGEALGVKKLAPHDLRRSFSRLADKNKASMEQLRITLGHSTIVTTQRYLGSDQNFAEAPCDVLGLDVEE